LAKVVSRRADRELARSPKNVGRMQYDRGLFHDAVSIPVWEGGAQSRMLITDKIFDGDKKM
jgi:hypothetical protein